MGTRKRRKCCNNNDGARTAILPEFPQFEMFPTVIVAAATTTNWPLLRTQYGKGFFMKSVIRCLAKDTIFDYCSPCFAMHVGAFFLVGMSLQFMSHSSPLLYLLWLFSSPREIFWSGADWLLLFVSVLSYFLIFPFSVLFCLDQGKYVVRKVLSAFAAAAAAPLL